MMMMQDAWSVESNDDSDKLLRLLSLIIFVASPLFIVEEGEFELELLCGS